MNEQTLDQLQRAAFGHFLQAVNPANGLIADTSRENSPASIGVVGFALSAYPVAVERGWMARADAAQRSLATLRFFCDSDQSGSPEATGFKGFYYHFENSRRATEVQREYARRNPHGFAGYDKNCWGLTACDGPSNQLPELANERRRLFGYAARGVPYGPDDGTLGGWAALASLPFAPETTLCAARNMLHRYPEMLSAQRYTSSVNPTLARAGRGAWVSAGHLGLDQGIVVMMIENYRTQLIWRLMRGCPYVRTGLRRAGFRGGWL